MPFFIGPAVAVAEAGSAIGAAAAAGTAASVGAAAVATASAVAAVATVAGLAMTLVGAATGDKGLMKIGGIVGLAGGVTDLATGAISGATSLADTAATAAEPAASSAVSGASGGLSDLSAAATPTDIATNQGQSAITDLSSGSSAMNGTGADQASMNAITPNGMQPGQTATTVPAAQSTPAVQTIGKVASGVSTPNSNQSWLNFLKEPASNGTAISQIASAALQGLNQQNNLQTQNQLTAQQQNYNQYLQNTQLRNANSPGGLNLTIAPVDPASAQAYKLAQAQLSANQAGLLAKG